ncbi:MAG: hypothetical protein IJ760_05475 [Bacteroidales bacterium]|nr:hypothetical protein [Bacteroidales bacterium]
MSEEMHNGQQGLPDPMTTAGQTVSEEPAGPTFAAGEATAGAGPAAWAVEAPVEQILVEESATAHEEEQQQAEKVAAEVETQPGEPAAEVPADEETEEPAAMHVEERQEAEVSADGASQVEEEQVVPAPMIRLKEFNIQKKDEAGEDSDPIYIFDDKKGIGLLCVFDGLGGAGARLYENSKTHVTHTAAWVASRTLREVVNALFLMCLRESDPIAEFLNRFDEKYIKEQMRGLTADWRVYLKPGEEPPQGLRFNSLTSEFPTTVAGCLFKADGDACTVEATTFWVGDSRVYLFNPDGMYFLTTDDADAPNGDPFAPENMDLKMAQTVCLDKPFKVNVEKPLRLHFSADRPLLLMAATDGCFGYFTNPILFEQMVRTTIVAETPEQWGLQLREGIMSNGFHDDISMAAVVIGTDVMAVASRALNARLGRDDIFGDFCAWRSEYEQELQRRRDETDGLMAQRKEMLEKINLAKENGKQRGELQQALDELNRQIDELQKKKEAMERQLGAMAGQGLSVEEMSQSKSRLDDEWKQKKAELDEYEYGSKRSNSKYYRKYREMMPKLAADEHQQ